MLVAFPNLSTYHFSTEGCRVGGSGTQIQDHRSQHLEVLSEVRVSYLLSAPPHGEGTPTPLPFVNLGGAAEIWRLATRGRCGHIRGPPQKSPEGSLDLGT